MTDVDLESRLLRHVNNPNYRPVKPRVIAKQLDLPDELQPSAKRVPFTELRDHLPADTPHFGSQQRGEQIRARHMAVQQRDTG